MSAAWLAAGAVRRRHRRRPEDRMAAAGERSRLRSHSAAIAAARVQPRTRGLPHDHRPTRHGRDPCPHGDAHRNFATPSSSTSSSSPAKLRTLHTAEDRHAHRRRRAPPRRARRLPARGGARGGRPCSREFGVINIGETAEVLVDGETYRAGAPRRPVRRVAAARSPSAARTPRFYVVSVRCPRGIPTAAIPFEQTTGVAIGDAAGARRRVLHRVRVGRRRHRVEPASVRRDRPRAGLGVEHLPAAPARPPHRDLPLLRPRRRRPGRAPHGRARSHPPPDRARTEQAVISPRVVHPRRSRHRPLLLRLGDGRRQPRLQRPRRRSPCEDLR